MFGVVNIRFSKLSSLLATGEVRAGLLQHYKYAVSTLLCLWDSLTRYPMRDIDELYLEGLRPELSLPSLRECPGSTQSDDLLGWSGFLWAVPKKRTSHSKKRMRMAHKYLQPKVNFVVCKTCNNLKLMHVLCGHCLKLTLEETATMRKEQELAKVELAKVESKGLTDQ